MSEQNTNTSEQSVSTEPTYDNIFERMADEYENKTNTVATSDTVSEDSSEDSEQLQQPEHKDVPVVNTANNTQSSPLTDNTDAPQASVDYRAMYEQLRQESEAKTGLLHSRLNELSDLYQSLKATQPTPQVPQEDTEEMAVVNEVKELFPDVYKTIEVMLKKEMESTKKSIQDLVNTSVQPLQQHISHNAQLSYRNKVESAHADVYNIINSGALKQWAEKQDAIKQMGINVIMSQGTAEQVIQLLNEYKQNNTQLTTQPNPSPTNTQSSINRDEEIAKRVAEMIGVPSKTPGMDIKTFSQQAKPEDYNTALMKSMQEWENRNRR